MVRRKIRKKKGRDRVFKVSTLLEKEKLCHPQQLINILRGLLVNPYLRQPGFYENKNYNLLSSVTVLEVID